MPSKRSEVESDDSSQPQAKRQVRHASRACDECRKRKIRCDGVYPKCSVCRTRKLSCHYDDEDRRKTNVEHMEHLNKRMDHFEQLLKDLLQGSNSTASNTAAAIEQEAAVGTSISPVQGFQQLVPDESDFGSMVPADLTDFIPQPSGQQGLVLSQIETSPVATTSLRTLQGGDDHDRFHRMEEGSGSLVKYGPTALWSAASPRPRPPPPISPRGRRSGDWVDWSRNLPSSLDISRPVHDQALSYFAANYAPWCLVVDMPKFLKDLTSCNLITGSPTDRGDTQFRTSHYSPLLHCCVVYLGLQLIRQQHAGLFNQFEDIFMTHCFKLLPVECDQTALSSLRAYSLFAICAHYNRTSLGQSKARSGDRQNATGYLYSGIAVAGVHALGLNIDCQEYVTSGQITDAERNERILTFWTVYVIDVFRALANGRQPMLPEANSVPYPHIQPTIDESPWKSPMTLSSSTTLTQRHMAVHGLRSMQSTSFHWTVKLAVLCRAILDQISNSKGARDPDAAAILLQRLETWYGQLPLHPPEATPLPHVLHLHMQYHLCVIFVLRPFYRGGYPVWANKCDQAALSILPLLHLLDATHGIRHCHHSFINVVFGAATIFLLRSVDPADNSRSMEDTQRFDECVQMMSRLSKTWSEAAMSEYILLKLQKEFHIPAPSSGTNVDPLAQIPMAHDAFFDLEALWGSTFSNEIQQWTDIINGGQDIDDMRWGPPAS